MKLVILDAQTLGTDISFDSFKSFGSLDVFAHTSEDECVDRCVDANIIITNKVKISRTTLERLPNLKLICIAATGTDNVDLVAAKELGVEVKNVAGYSTDSVVQHTFAMLFHLLNDLSYYDRFTKEHKWEEQTCFTHFLPYHELAGKKFGVIGLGAIGHKVATVAKAFGAQVCYYSTSGKNTSNDFSQVSLEELLSSCSVVSVHAPLNDKTMNLLNKSNLGIMQDDAVLLNLGRGGIINEADLDEILKTKQFRVGLDVIATEPPPKNSTLHSLVNHKNVLVTPHIAWASQEARSRLVEKIASNIQEFIR